MDSGMLPLLVLLLTALTGGLYDVEAATAQQETKLRKQLLTSYDRAQPPEGAPLTVRFYMDIVHVELYSNSDMMSIEGLVYLAWEDKRLSWVGTEVTNLDVYTDEIWVPDLGVMHRWRENPEYGSLPRTRCVLSASGHLECMPPASFWSHCAQDLTAWPYSLHNCTLRLGSSLLSHQLKLDLSGVFFVYELATRSWDHLDMTSQVEESSNRSTVLISIVMKQISKLQTAVFIAPAFVLAGLSVSTWLLPVVSSERLLLGTLSIFLHSSVIDSLSFALPENGDKPAQVVLLYRDLTLVAAASFSAAVLLSGLSKLRGQAGSSWLPGLLASAPARLLLCAPPGSLRLQEDDDVEGLVSQEEQPVSTTPPGAPLALLLDRVGLVVVSTTCVAALILRVLV